MTKDAAATNKTGAATTKPVPAEEEEEKGLPAPPKVEKPSKKLDEVL